MVRGFNVFFSLLGAWYKIAVLRRELNRSKSEANELHSVIDTLRARLDKLKEEESDNQKVIRGLRVEMGILEGHIEGLMLIIARDRERTAAEAAQYIAMTQTGSPISNVGKAVNSIINPGA